MTVIISNNKQHIEETKNLYFKSSTIYVDAEE